MKAYYFSTTEKKLLYGDNRKIREGITHVVEFPFKDCDGNTWDAPTLCQAGLHASVRAIDALRYAPGPWLWLVELSGEIVEGSDKVVASSRTYIKGFDATQILQEFARYCAGLNVELIMPCCSAEEYNIIIEFLETGKNASAAAKAVANAVWDVDYYADKAAYYAAAKAVANAAYYATRAAANAAVDAANINFAVDAANINSEDYISELNIVLEQMIEKVINNI